MATARLFLDGAWADGGERSVVEHKFSGESLAELHHASREQVGEAVAALAAARSSRQLTPYESASRSYPGPRSSWTRAGRS